MIQRIRFEKPKYDSMFGTNFHTVSASTLSDQLAYVCYLLIVMQRIMLLTLLPLMLFNNVVVVVFVANARAFTKVNE